MPKSKTASPSPAIGANGALGGNSRQQLRSYVERVERIESNIRPLLEDVKEIYTEAKSVGFDPGAMRALVRERKQDADKRRERQMIIDTYRNAMGDMMGTPLEVAQRPREFSDADAPRTAMGT